MAQLRGPKQEDVFGMQYCFFPILARREMQKLTVGCKQSSVAFKVAFYLLLLYMLLLVGAFISSHDRL